MKNKLTQQLEEYIPFNEQEEKDKEVMLRFLKEGKDIFSRNNTTAHFTASAWVTSTDTKYVLMAYHNLYHSWSWLGGHADGEEDLLKVAIREVKEESGLKVVTQKSDEIFSIEVLTVDGHIKNNKYISSHLHLNVTYLLEADHRQPTRIKPDENSGVEWFLKEEAIAKSSEIWLRNTIYNKLNQKLDVYLKEV